MVSDQCPHCPSLATEIKSLKARVGELERSLRVEAEKIDTLWTPLHKKLWFWINGWPLYRLTERPKSRPWHRFMEKV